MSARVVTFVPEEVRILGAGSGVVRPPAYSHRYATLAADIEVVIAPFRDQPHGCPAQRRSRPPQRAWRRV